MTSKRTVRLSLKILRKKFRRGMTVRKYRDKEVVFSQGDRADAVYHIQDGTVKLTAVSTRRKKAIIAFLQRGSFFGEGCLGGNPYGSARRDQLGSPVSPDCQRRAWSVPWCVTRGLRRGLLNICFPGLFESKKTWRINSSISAKGVWHGFCCCLGR